MDLFPTRRLFTLKDCYLGVKLEKTDVRLHVVIVDALYYPFRTVTNHLEVECTQVFCVKVWVSYLEKRDPVERQVLKLRTVHLFTKDDVD